jgi:TP901 family phage tail tape measure protein
MTTTTVASLEAVFTADTRNFDRGADAVDSRMNNLGTRMGASMQNIGRSMTGMGLRMVAVAAPIAGAFGVAINSAIQFESAFAGVAKTVDATDDELSMLRAGLMAMATDENNPLAGMENAAVELARIAELGGQLGVAAGDIEEFTQVIGEMSLATDLTSEAAATMSAQFANIMGLDIANLRNFGSTIVDLGNNSATTESQILAMATRLAGIGATLGISTQDILGLSAAMSSVGLQAEAGGTAMTTIFNELLTAVAGGGAELETFARVAGTSASDFAAAWSANPVDALTLFLEGFAELDQAAQASALADLGLDGIRVADTIRRLSANTDLLTESLGRANTAWDENSALSTEANARFATTESQVNLAKNQLNNLAVVVGSILLPIVNDLVAGIGDMAVGFARFADEHPALVSGVAKIAFGLLGLGLAATVLGPIISGLGTIIGLVSSGIVALGAALGITTLAAGGLVLLAAALAVGVYKVADALGVDWGLIGRRIYSGLAWAFEAVATTVQNLTDLVSGLVGLIGQITGLSAGPATSAEVFESIAAGGGTAAQQMALGRAQAQAEAWGNSLGASPGDFGRFNILTTQPFGRTATGGNTPDNVGRTQPAPDLPEAGDRGAIPRAGGGSVFGSGNYLVGEQGPELFTPSRNGTIIPNSALMAADGGGRVVNIYDPVFNGIQDIAAAYDAIEREAGMRG